MPLGDAELLIFGMGRVGAGAYEALRGELVMLALPNHQANLDAAFNFYSQAGQGYADLVRSTLG